jgi:outer membrane receptor protein involved in Fe transport
MDIFKKFTLLTFALVSVAAFADAPGDDVESSSSSDDVVETTVASEDTASSAMNVAVDEGDGEVENVVVTGSAFGISQYKTSQPVTIISGEEILRNNYTNAASALFDLPQISVSASTAGDQQGLQAGQRVANNFGLGSGRTLTLVNGRRFVSSTPINYAGTNTGAVDLNNIPVALIDRIEVLSAGGSAVYGSDAIAGVINYVMNREYTGMEVAANYTQQYLGDIQNNDGNHALAITVGGEFNDGKGHIVLAMQRDVQEAIYEGQLDRYRGCHEDVIYSRTYADGKPYQNAYTDASMPLPRGGGIPQGEIGMCYGLSFLPFEGAAADPYWWSNQNIVIGPSSGPRLGRHIFTPDGGVIPHDPGTSTGSAFFTYGGNSMSYNDNQTIQASLERQNISAFLTYELTDNINLKVDLFRNSQFSSESGNTTGGPYFYLGFGGDLDGGYANPPYISCDYPYLNDSGKEFCNDMGWGGMLIFKTIRDLYESSTGGMTETDTTVDSLVASLDGTFEIANREMSWEAGFSTGEVFSLGTSEDIIRERIITATDVGINPNTGEIDCKMNYVDGYLGITYSSLYNPYYGAESVYTPQGFGSAGLPGDCKPYNPLGYNPGQTEAMDYILVPQVRRAQNDQTIHFASLAGTLYTLPAGDIQFSVGVESREEVLEFWSDSAQNMKLTRSSVQPNNKAGYETDESYVELSIPVIDESMGLTFNGYGIQELRLDVSRREIDNTFSGEYTVQAENVYWQISDDLALRGGTQNAVRTPGLDDVFGPQATTYQRANDPCDYRFIDSGIYPTVRRANCQAESWWFEGWQSQIVNRTEEGVTGGNPNLLNELGDTTTVGIIFTPTYDFIPGTLSLAFDVVTIDVVDVVQAFSVSQNMAGCYDYADKPAKFCDTFTRVTDPADTNNGKYNLGDVNSFSFGPNNVGVRNFETHIITADHSMDTKWGVLSTRFRGYHQQIFESAPTGNPEDLEDFTGDYSEPEWLYDITIGLSRDNHAVFYQVDGRSGGYIEKFQNIEDQPDKYIGLNGEPILEWDGWWTDAVSYTYTPNDNMAFAVNLTNPFDLDGDEDRFPAERNLRLSQTLSVGFRYSF